MLLFQSKCFKPLVFYFEGVWNRYRMVSILVLVALSVLLGFLSVKLGLKLILLPEKLRIMMGGIGMAGV